MAQISSSAVTCATCELHAEAVFRVEGMDCNEEVVILERRLKPLDGLEAMAADVMGQRLHVKYDAARLTTAAMVEAVRQTGMRMWLEHEAPRPSSADARGRLRLMAVAGVMLAAGAAIRALGADAIGAVLLGAATLAGGVHPAKKALTALRSRTVDINVLMVVAVAGALALGEWLEAASVVFLFAVAQWLEVRTLERARQAIRSMLDLSPRVATLVRDGREEQAPVESLQPGDIVRVKPGEKVAVDGEIVDGSSDVNEAPITGESLPIDKLPGDAVFGGSINGHGALDVRVTRVGPDTRLARVIHLVEDAQAQRAPVQAFVDRFARIYTPAVIALALLVALVPPLAADAAAEVWLYRALVLLVIACPCALVISTPVSIVAALSAAAKQGVLIKGGAYLERLAAARTVAFDKTGTLTTGHLHVTAVVPLGASARRNPTDATVIASKLPIGNAAAGPRAEDAADERAAVDVLRWAAAVESRSEHPVGRAILRRALEQGIDVPDVNAFSAVPGMGAMATVAGHTVHVGNQRLLDRAGVPQRDVSRPDVHGSAIFVAVDAAVLGVIVVADTVRPAAREAVDLLRAQGVSRVVMLSGDAAPAVEAAAAAVGIDETRASLLPEEKHAVVQSLTADGAVLMVGDGINDAPALAAADVGIAMGAAASDVAMETADVALMSGELLKLPYAVRLARATVRNIKANVAVSLVMKAAFVAMAVTGSATLWMAILADTGASVIVVANALRLLRSR